MATSPLLVVEHVTKRYGDSLVLRDVSLAADGGEIVALVGENGAGKSTLMKILAGVVPSSEYEGSIQLDGEQVRFGGPRDAEAAGVVMIPQELAVVPHLSVAENLLLNREPGRLGFIDTPSLEADARAILDDAGIDIDGRRPMLGLGLASQQLVEIAKALSKRARIVILDEPTASLTTAEADRLFERLRGLRSRGHLCIYISHRIEEVLAIADRVVVLRDGEVAGRATGQEATKAELVRMMLGRSLGDLYPAIEPAREAVALRVEHLTVIDPIVPSRALVDDVSFEIKAGEILGMFGLIGAGRTELVSTLFGAAPGPRTGTISIRGTTVDIKKPDNAIKHGLGLVTEDRRRFGFVPEFGFTTNASLASIGRISQKGWLDLQREEVLGVASARELRLHATSLDQPVKTLSGGNQQKVVIAKWLATDPAVLMLDDPTRGVDVGAKADLYRFLVDLAARGVAILFVSSEANELVGLAHRIVVMAQGRIVAERTHGTTEEELLHLASSTTELEAAHQ